MSKFLLYKLLSWQRWQNPFLTKEIRALESQESIPQGWVVSALALLAALYLGVSSQPPQLWAIWPPAILLGLAIDQYWNLAPRLASSVRAERLLGVCRLLELTPSGNNQLLYTKLGVLSLPYCLDWLGVSLLLILSYLLGAPLVLWQVLSAIWLSFWVLISALALGLFWGLGNSKTASSCGDSLRTVVLCNLLLVLVARILPVHQVEVALWILALGGATWALRFKGLSSGSWIGLGVIGALLTFLSPVRLQEFPLIDILNPLTMGPIALYALDPSSLYNPILTQPLYEYLTPYFMKMMSLSNPNSFGYDYLALDPGQRAQMLSQLYRGLGKCYLTFAACSSLALAVAHRLTLRAFRLS